MAFFSSGMGLTAFRSLSRAMLRGFVRDRTALAFTILLPVLFLALFGSLYRNAATPKLSVIEIGNVSLLSHIADQPDRPGWSATWLSRLTFPTSITLSFGVAVFR